MTETVMAKTEGDKLRDEGVERVSRGKTEWLKEVRDWAWKYAESKGYVTINEVRAHFVLPEGAHHNLWGAAFKSSGLVPRGVTKNKVAASAHSRAVRVWVVPDNA